MSAKIYFADDIEKMFPDPVGDYGFAPKSCWMRRYPGL